MAAAALPGLKARTDTRRVERPWFAAHSWWATRLARLVPFYEYDETRFFRSDDAPAEIASRRRDGFMRLAEELRRDHAKTIALTAEVEAAISDLQFTAAHRVPFQYRRYVRRHFDACAFVAASAGVAITDLDGKRSYDLSGSYGVNLLGYDFYKGAIERAVRAVGELGPVLGAYHPVIASNVRRLRQISGLDEVSFHMSGTEAVMQAVRLARYHTGRSHLVRFSGAYHGWWDEVQPGVGSPRPARETLTLRDMDPASLRVLERRRDVACVLVNPLQALHPNSAAPADSTLLAGPRSAGLDRPAYTDWLRRLRAVCRERDIVLILDEVFVGFRLARGGAQEYFGVAADMVTYGKTLGGGLPVGVLCGRRDLMKRFREDRPLDICFARGTFNSHPYVMAAMNEFLAALETPELRRLYADLDAVWDARAQALDARLRDAGLPVRIANLSSIWTVGYTRAARYNWMLQYYLRAEGLALSWVGTGRIVFSLDYTDADFQAVADRFVAAAQRMSEDGWWWSGDGLTSGSIKRRIARELLGRFL